MVYLDKILKIPLLHDTNKSSKDKKIFSKSLGFLYLKKCMKGGTSTKLGNWSILSKIGLYGASHG